MPSKPRILVVEDESAIADTVLYVLANDGFAPQWCATAQEAVASFAQERPALAILDVGLPDLNGFDLFRQLHALPGGREVPMLFLTARSDEIDRVVGLELGADDYVAKPFSPRELLARVRAILRRSARLPAPVAEQTPQPFDLDEERQRIRYYGRPLELSRYEYGILRVLLQKAGRVFSREELLARVWVTSQLLASLVEQDVRGGVIDTSRLAPLFQSVYARRFDARIFSLSKEKVELRMVVTDRAGRVVFDSLGRDAGADWSRWNEILLALRGQYGARTTADAPEQPQTSVMYVAAPVRWNQSIVGVVSVGKPVQSFGQFVEAARRKHCTSACCRPRESRCSR